MARATKSKQVLRIFVGSPGDVGAERAAAFEAIAQLGQDPHYRDHWSIEGVGWDRSCYARDTYVTPQMAIDKGLQPSSCDIAVFIFRHRVGTTLPADSYPVLADTLPVCADVPLTGSLWELHEALRARSTQSHGPRLLVLRGKPCLDLASLEGEPFDEAVRQLKDLRAFFAGFASADGTLRRDVIDFDSTAAFATLIETQLREHVSALTQASAPNSARRAGPRANAAKNSAFPPVPGLYKAWFEHEIGRANLLGLDSTLGAAGPVRLRDIYVPCVTRDGKREISSGPASMHEGPALVPMLGVLNERSLYVSGGAGSGKTTFANWACWLALQGAVPGHPQAAPPEFAEAFPEALRGRLPVMCALRHFVPDLNLSAGKDRLTPHELEDALAAWLDRSRPGDLDGATFRAYLAAGRCLLVFDGFDEVPASRELPDHGRAYPRKALLSGFGAAFALWEQRGNRILLTARPYGLSAGERQALALSEAAIAPLPAELSALFIRRWFHATDPEHQQSLVTALEAELDKSELPADVLTNSMMLSALCVKFGEGKRLPADVHELFDSLINLVLHMRFSDRAREVEPIRKRLGAIALGMHGGDIEGSMPNSYGAEIGFEALRRLLVDYAAANPVGADASVSPEVHREDLLSRSGLLLPKGEARAEFLHLNFQDFLAAERLYQRAENIRADIAACVAQHCGNPSWQQTLRFLFAGLARHRGPDLALECFSGLISQFERAALKANALPATLAAACLELVHARSSTQAAAPAAWSTALRTACLASLEVVSQPEPRAQLFAALGRLGLDDRPGVGLRDGLPDIVWIDIPAGTVQLEDIETSFAVAPFAVAQYPLTWLQFQCFVDAADGYCEARWWHGVPKGARRTEPRRAQWEFANHPRDTVDWYEATAFCRWLSAKTQQQIRLPSEMEWQQAATGGQPHNVYPWGERYESGRANCDEIAAQDGPLYLQRTSAVGLYPSGRSRHAVHDLAGNVWEWCSNRYDEPLDSAVHETALRVVRGGSWFDPPQNSRSEDRPRLDSGGAYGFLGFRLARTLA